MIHQTPTPMVEYIWNLIDSIHAAAVKARKYVLSGQRIDLCSLPCSGATPHDLVCLLSDQLAARRSALRRIFSLGLVIADVHKLRVVVAICWGESAASVM